MGGHGHGSPYQVPHYSTFKVEGVPQLEELERVLARKGLKDPWIRNEAWRYHPGFGTPWPRARALFFRGAPLGFALALVTAGAGMLLGGSSGGDHH